MREAQAGGVQKHALERRTEQASRHLPVEVEVPVLVVTHEREALGERMDANLVRAPRLELRIKIADGAVALQKREDRVAGTPST